MLIVQPTQMVINVDQGDTTLPLQEKVKTIATAVPTTHTVPLSTSEASVLCCSSRSTAGRCQKARYIDSYVATVVGNCQDDGYISAIVYNAKL
jgi:hypothetical protein